MKGVIKEYRDTGEKKKRKHFFLDGVEVSKRKFDKAFPPKPIFGDEGPGGHGLGCWPKLADDLGCHPNQVKEAMKDAAAKGVPTDFAPDGRIIYRDRAHRAAYHKAYGYFDRAGGYSDAQRGGSDPRRRGHYEKPHVDPYAHLRKYFKGPPIPERELARRMR